MRPDLGFDACYRSNRANLLHETFLLTGDVRAASSAVREAFVIAWQHWERVDRMDDAMEYIRPLAWRLALRRHRGRIWHRNKGISDEDKAVLDALHKIPLSGRRVLLAVEAANLSIEEAGRQTHLTAEAAELQVREAREQLASILQIPTELIGDRLHEIAYAAAVAGTLPRISIVMRSGTKRRRVQSLLAVAAALGLVLIAGAVSADPHRSRPGANAEFLPPPTTTSTTAANQSGIDVAQLVGIDTIEAAVPGRDWSIDRTDSNASGDGLNSVCQSTRYADPLGLGTFVRVFSAQDQKLTAVETLESSRTAKRATNAYKVTQQWFGGCKAPRLYLAKAFKIDGLGDRAALIFLDQMSSDPVTHAVGLARIGNRTVSLVFSTPLAQAPKPDALLSALTDAAAGFCGAACLGVAPTLEPALPNVDTPKRLLAAVDLPPVSGLDAIWVGTAPQAKLEPVATSECKTPGFADSGATSIQGRTFLMPQASVSVEFGAEETVGRFGGPTQAADFATSFTKALQTCANKDFTVQLTSYGKGRTGNATYQSWLLQTRVNRKVTLQVRVGLVRLVDTIAVVVFTPSSSADMGKEAFSKLTRRAAERL